MTLIASTVSLAKLAWLFITSGNGAGEADTRRNGGAIERKRFDWHNLKTQEGRPCFAK
jgi:hypothetical protein